MLIDKNRQFKQLIRKLKKSADGNLTVTSILITTLFYYLWFVKTDGMNSIVVRLMLGAFVIALLVSSFTQAKLTYWEKKFDESTKYRKEASENILKVDKRKYFNERQENLNGRTVTPHIVTSVSPVKVNRDEGSKVIKFPK